MTSPVYGDIDLAVGKDVVLKNSARLDLWWEVFNLLNRTNFGRIFSAGPARQMQLGIKIVV